MKYTALNNHLVVTPRGERSSFDIGIDNKNHTGIGIREKFLDGNMVKMSECLSFIVVSSAVKGIEIGDEVWIRNSSVNYIGGDVENYWCEEKDIMLLKDKPYKDNVLCRNVVEKSKIVVPGQLESNINNAFVYHAGNEKQLKSGDYVAYNYRKINSLTFNGEKMFVIDKKDILAVIEQDEQ